MVREKEEREREDKRQGYKVALTNAKSAGRVAPSKVKGYISDGDGIA